MKKGILFIIFIVLLLIGVNVQETSSETEYQIIPDEAIRLRILANSDSEQDQYIKRLVRDQVNEFLTEKVQDIDKIDKARNVINQNVPEIRKIVAETLRDAGDDHTFSVAYRSDVTFPMKVYDHYVYPAGEYEAILVSIGEGKGSNWWCVLFPPLCFLDFSNGSTIAQTDEESVETFDNTIEDERDQQTEKDEEDDVEVKFFLFEWLGLS